MLHQIGHITFLNDLWSLSSIWNFNTMFEYPKAAHVCSYPNGDASDLQLRERASENNAKI
jgi:hypothetical protein